MAMKKLQAFKKAIFWFPSMEEVFEENLALVQDILKDSGQEIPEDVEDEPSSPQSMLHTLFIHFHLHYIYIIQNQRTINQKENT